MRKFLVLLTGFFCIVQVWAQEIKRPPVWGIAKVTYWVSSHELAGEFYGSLLGFEEAFCYQG